MNLAKVKVAVAVVGLIGITAAPGLVRSTRAFSADGQTPLTAPMVSRTGTSPGRGAAAESSQKTGAAPPAGSVAAAQPPVLVPVRDTMGAVNGV